MAQATVEECITWYGEKRGRAIFDHWEKARTVAQKNIEELLKNWRPSPPHWHCWLRRYLDEAPNGKYAYEARKLLKEFELVRKAA